MGICESVFCHVATEKATWEASRSWPLRVVASWNYVANDKSVKDSRRENYVEEIMNDYIRVKVKGNGEN